jgi:uncharacterized protein (DUF1800 family)
MLKMGGLQEIDMEKTADWIMRRAGFGFNLTKDPITQKQWVESTRSSLEKPELYIKDTRFEEFDQHVNSKLKGEEAQYLKGMVKSESGSIIYYETYKNREKELRVDDRKRSESVHNTFIKTRPLWASSHRRFDFAMNTDHDFLNRIWFFWLNYFTVGNGNGSLAYVPHFQETIRKKMSGSMEGLVYNVITHPAMLTYLDNNSSVGVNSIARKKGWTKDGVNENLGRELLELYTLKPPFGYTQDDVNGVTNVLTGWRVQRWDGKYQVVFEPNRHEPMSQKILGESYSGSGKTGQHKLKRLVRHLSSYSATGVNVSFRLCQHFISDSPSPDHVRELSQIYDKEKGELSKVYVGLLEILDRLPHENSKFLNPEIWTYQCFKTLNVETFKTVSNNDRRFYPRHIEALLKEMGMLHGLAAQPNGWPETEAGWISNEYLDRRLRLSAYFSGNIKGYKSNTVDAINELGFTKAQLDRFGLPPMTMDIIQNKVANEDMIPALFSSPEFLRS